MTREEWTRIKGIANDALAAPPAERALHVAKACAGDDALRREVDALLAAVARAADLYEGEGLRVGGGERAFDLVEATAAARASTRSSGTATPAPPDHEFLGTERYAVRRRLGTGGMGVVYAVEDRARAQLVALKTLRRWDAADIYGLKQEFRSLSDIAHPNLASLYDLVVDERHCFFTMALVDGLPLVDYVRTDGASATVADRLRGVLPQLIDGVLALHRHGTLHRDLKPSNVLVTPQGQVVVLDFGLTATIGAVAAERRLIGTPAYLAPEQCTGEPATDASDWYAVGVTLFQALTGVLPFDGPTDELFRLKTSHAAPSPRRHDPDVPEDLEAICRGWLDRDPATRLRGHDALALLRGPGNDARPAPGPEVHAAFVGRESQLLTLEAALDRVRRGQQSTVVVHGPSGIGKSALLRQFVGARQSGASVLQSRCHEHESIVYKGLDGVVDGLRTWLRRLPATESAALVPANAGALGVLFPVLQDLPGWPAPAVDLVASDPPTLRRQAFAVLRELVGRVAGRQPLIVEIDDVHWADPESVVAVTALVDGPDPPAVLLLLSFRSEEVDAKPFLRTLLDRVDGRTTVSLPLGPLTPSQVDRLVGAVLPLGGSVDASGLAAIARDSGGNPFLVEQLARDAALDADGRHGVTLEEVLRRRLDVLPADARPFLDTLAVCGRPMSAARVFEACGLDGDERPLVAQLRTAHLLRGSRAAGRVELYHDRIRETLAAQVPLPVARGIHQRLADILLAHGDDDPEALFEHYRASDRPVPAAAQAAGAARNASAVLAFDRAAAYYQHALDLHPASDRRTEWAAGLATALENAGRPVAAAQAYLAAVGQARRADQLEWRRKAAELLLIGGRIDEGLEVMHDVLDTVGVRLAGGPRRALASLAARRLHLRWRGLTFTPRPEAPAVSDDLLRIDACWSVAVGLAMVDPLRAADCNVRQLHWALAAGDGSRVARALALEAGFSVIIPVAGGGGRAAELTRRAEALAGDSQPYVSALTSVWAGIGAFLTGRWADATRLCGGALVTLRDRCTGVTWELNLARGFFLYSLVYRGELREAAGYVPDLLDQARERGNVYLALELSTRLSLVWLAADEPDDAERVANDSLARWVQRGFQRPHYHHLLTLVQTRLYRGQVREAWELVSRHRTPLGQSQFRRVQHTRVETANCRARCALAMAAAGHTPRAMRALAGREANRIRQERMPWAAPFARLIDATVAFQDGEADRAVAELEAALAAFEAADMFLYAAAARRRLASLVDGPRGRAYGDAAAAWFTAQEVRNPTALVRVLAPGFPD